MLDPLKSNFHIKVIMVCKDFILVRNTKEVDVLPISQHRQKVGGLAREQSEDIPELVEELQQGGLPAIVDANQADQTGSNAKPGRMVDGETAIILKRDGDSPWLENRAAAQQAAGCMRVATTRRRRCDA